MAGFHSTFFQESQQKELHIRDVSKQKKREHNPKNAFPQNEKAAFPQETQEDRTYFIQSIEKKLTR